MTTMIYTDFKAISHVARTYYKDDGYCTVVSLAVCAGVGYGKAFHVFKRLGRVTGTGTRFPMQVAAFKELGLTLKHIESRGIRTINQAETYLRGTRGKYLVYSTRHVSAVVDGVMYDWASGGSRKRVTGIYQIVAA
jgi:hypothetical protein